MSSTSDTFYMKKALKQAKVALSKAEVPIGAIVIDKQGKIIARAHNAVEQKQTQTAHAEMIAIQRAARKIGSWRLEDCTIYVTLEPCLMCFSLIQLSRLNKIAYGARSTLFGVSTLEEHPIYAKKIEIEGGILKDECLELLTSFFNNLRPKRKGSCESKG